MQKRENCIFQIPELRDGEHFLGTIFRKLRENSIFANINFREFGQHSRKFLRLKHIHLPGNHCCFAFKKWNILFKLFNKNIFCQFLIEWNKVNIVSLRKFWCIHSLAQSYTVKGCFHWSKRIKYLKNMSKKLVYIETKIQSSEFRKKYEIPK